MVTGAAGFIGSHLANHLLDSGYDVIGVDNFSNGKQQNIDFINQNKHASSFLFIDGDLRDLDICNTCCRDIDVIYHQAALGSVPRSINEPQLYFDNNLGGMINLLESARKNKVKRFIFASSSSVYGDTPTLPKIETMPVNPKSPYAASKASGEQYLRIYQDIYGLETIGFRYFNVFGPRQDPTSQYAAVIPKFFDQCFSGQPITINGTGEQTRDFTYVENVVRYNLNALNAPIEATNKIYNIGCGEQISILKLSEIIRDISKKSVDITFQTPRQGDVKNSLADLTLLNHHLAIPNCVYLKEGLSKTFEWLQSSLTT